jgi:MFS family permease
MLVPFVVSLTVASIVSGQIVSRTGKYKLVLIIGSLMMVASMCLLASIDGVLIVTKLIIGMILAGVGIGSNMPIFIVIVQSSFGHDRLGIVTSSMQLFRNIGATMGVAVLGTIITSHVEKNLLTFSLADLGVDKIDPNDFQRILEGIQKKAGSVQVLTELQNTFTEAISSIFFMCMFVSILILIATAFLPTIPLRKTNRPFISE